MKKAKRLLLLGGSAQQIVAIRVAKSLGVYTILCDYLPDNPGQYIADKYYCISTTDIEAVAKVAFEERVDGILAYASDPAALTAAIVSERMSLPTNPSRSVEILGTKHNFRKFLSENKFSCPAFFSFNIDDEIDYVLKSCKKLRLPIIIKPTDSSGSKGVSIVWDRDGIKSAIECAKQYSRNKVLIAEEFIERGYPNVIGGDVFIEDGKVVLWGEMECLRGEDGKGIIPIGEMLPAGISATQRKNLHEEIERLIKLLDIKSGEFNIEVIIDENDMPHFLEIGPRAGGNMIPIQLSDAFGVDLPKANVLASLGEKIQISAQRGTDAFMHYVVHSHRDCTYSGISISPEIKQYVYKIKEYKKEGDRIEPFNGAGKAVGIVFLKFPNAKIMREFASRMEELIKIE